MVQGQAQTAYGHNISHLKECISITAGDASTSLLTSLTALVYLANGHLATDLRPFLYGANSTGFAKATETKEPLL